MSKKATNGIDAEGELIELTPKQLMPLLIEHAKAAESVGIEGPPGAAKSELVAQAAKAVNLHLYISNCELEDSTDGKGLPFRDSENPHQVIWLKDRKYLLDHPSAFFHDELPRGMVPVQGTKASMLLENRIDDLYLPKGTWHVWAGNRTADKAGANRVPTIIYNRCYMYAVRYDAESHIEHELTVGDTDMLTIRYLRMKGDQAYSFDAAKKINATPRSWSTVARRLFAFPDTGFATIAGRIGKGYASELMAFRDLAPTLPSPEEVQLNPTKARVPENTSAQFLVTDMLADHANKTSFDALVTYAKRLPPEMQAKFVKDSMIRTPEVSSTKAFVEWGVKFAEVLR
jgi:hypothetical protein